MDIVPKENFDFFLSDQARIAKQFAQPTKAKHKLLAAADEAFDVIGGVPRFAMWADQNPSDFYKMYAKTLPQNIDVTGEITIRPALPPSPLDDPIDVTPESAHEGRTGSSVQPDGGPPRLSAPGHREGPLRGIQFSAPPDRDGQRADLRPPQPEADGEGGMEPNQI